MRRNGREGQRNGGEVRRNGGNGSAPVRKQQQARTTGCSVRGCLTQLPSGAAMHASNPRDQMNMRMHPREAASRVPCTAGAWRREACGLRVRA